jgi:hypothetical protein
MAIIQCSMAMLRRQPCQPAMTLMFTIATRHEQKGAPVLRGGGQNAWSDIANQNASPVNKMTASHIPCRLKGAHRYNHYQLSLIPRVDSRYRQPSVTSSIVAAILSRQKIK